MPRSAHPQPPAKVHQIVACLPHPVLCVYRACAVEYTTPTPTETHTCPYTLFSSCKDIRSLYRPSIHTSQHASLPALPCLALWLLLFLLLSLPFVVASLVCDTHKHIHTRPHSHSQTQPIRQRSHLSREPTRKTHTLTNDQSSSHSSSIETSSTSAFSHPPQSAHPSTFRVLAHPQLTYDEVIYDTALHLAGPTSCIHNYNSTSYTTALPIPPPKHATCCSLAPYRASLRCLLLAHTSPTILVHSPAFACLAWLGLAPRATYVQEVLAHRVWYPVVGACGASSLHPSVPRPIPFIHAWPCPEVPRPVPCIHTPAVRCTVCAPRRPTQ